MSFDIVKEAMGVISESITPHDSLMIALRDIGVGDSVHAYGANGREYKFTKGVDGWLCHDDEWNRLRWDFDGWIVGFVYNNWRVTEDDFITEECDHHDQCEEFMRLRRDQ